MTIFMKAYIINLTQYLPNKYKSLFVVLPRIASVLEISTFKVILFNLSFNNDKRIVVGLSTFKLFHSKILPKRHSNLHLKC